MVLVSIVFTVPLVCAKAIVPRATSVVLLMALA